MLAMRPEKFANLENVTLTIDEPESSHWHRRAADLFGKTIQLCKEADVELEVTTVERNYEYTFSEYWGLDYIWHDIRFKDGKNVREEKRPKTAEEIRQAMAAILTPEQQEMFERTFERACHEINEQEANYGWETDYSDDTDLDEESDDYYGMDEEEEEDEDEEDPEVPSLE
ncbi:Nucleolar protein 58 [Venturia nashicola]|nr:Nucleolar protein 58 [Venturia nashicola]